LPRKAFNLVMAEPRTHADVREFAMRILSQCHARWFVPNLSLAALRKNECCGLTFNQDGI
jgi:hypothetical protein